MTTSYAQSWRVFTLRDLLTTVVLPSKQYLEALFSHKAPNPTTEEDIDADDRTRRDAILELLTTRVAAGFKQESALKRWQSIVNMLDNGKHTLWQQRAYIVAFLDERDDKGAVGKSSSSLLFDNFSLWEFWFRK